LIRKKAVFGLALKSSLPLKKTAKRRAANGSQRGTPVFNRTLLEEPMKAVILAGGLGTRLSEETVLRPKPMVEIGGKPILWHIMKI
jgi:hypothetical protein